MMLISYGTRPEALKIAPLVNKLAGRCLVLFTGQHPNGYEIKHDYSFYISNNGHRLDSIVSSILSQFYLIDEGVTHVMVQGDTTSAMAVALAAFQHGMRVIHLEAGLRSYDRQHPYPEEVNRRIISQVADIHLCPTYWNAQNLKDEKVQGKTYVVGNTGLDGLKEYKRKCRYNDVVLVTMHRRENLPIMSQWFDEINALAKEYDHLRFIMPIHPNPEVRTHRHLLSDVDVVDSLPRNELLDILVKARLVITDSGGLQEECAYFNKICLVCRKTTERPEALDNSSVLVGEPHVLKMWFQRYVNDYRVTGRCPFGDGNSTEKVIKILEKSGI